MIATDVSPHSRTPLMDFRAFYETHVRFVWRALVRVGVPENELPDAVQDVFLVAHRRIAEFEGRSSETTWLWGVSLRVASDRRRRAHVRREIPSIEVPIGVVEADETSLDRRRARDFLEAILQRMPDEQRLAFSLFELEGMSGDEIASLLDVPVGTIRSRLRLARATFDEAVARLRRREDRVFDKNTLESIGGAMSDPKRLLDTVPFGGLERSLLEIGRDAEPTAAQCDQIWKELSAALPLTVGVGLSAAGAKGAVASKSLVSAWLLKSVIAVAIAGSIGGALTLAVRADEVSNQVSPPTSLPKAPSPASIPSASGDPRTIATPVEPSSASPAPRPRTSPKPRVTNAAPVVPAPDDAATLVRLESAAVRNARELLRRGDCAGARSELHALDARIPTGVLDEEREVTAIDALACQGQPAEAARRAESFVRRFPSSAHTAPLRQRFLR